MKIARLKTAGAAVIVLLVIAAYPVLTHAHSAGTIKPAAVRQAVPVVPPPPVPVTKFIKNATLSGRVVYANGRPAPGVRVVIGLQEKAEADLDRKTPEADWGRINAIAGDGTVTKADGSYRFEVAADLPYNIMVELAKLGAEDDRTVGWVAAANEGMIGKANKARTLPDLVLTKGVFVTGLVTDQVSGKALSGVYVGSHGPQRPASTGMIIITPTDQTGQYRLRVVPGSNEIYIADGRYNGLFTQDARAKGLMKKVAVAQGQPARVDFRVSLQKKP